MQELGTSIFDGHWANKAFQTTAIITQMENGTTMVTIPRCLQTKLLPKTSSDLILTKLCFDYLKSKVFKSSYITKITEDA